MNMSTTPNPEYLASEHLLALEATLQTALFETNQFVHTDTHLDDAKYFFDVTGTSMAALYAAATCARGCRGGSHVMERLCGRIYNLACGAYALLCRGLYDEALNLIRGIGEAGNLLVLFHGHPRHRTAWESATEKSRRRDYGPKQVRDLLKGTQTKVMVATDAWYAEFCAQYTHVTPHTVPNLFTIDGRPMAGPCYQEQGFREALVELNAVMLACGLHACRHFGLDDISAIIEERVRRVEAR
jgi:hypothetical protein